MPAMDQVSAEARREVFYRAVQQAHNAFPKQSDENANQLYKQWNDCQSLLLLVSHLRAEFKDDVTLRDDPRLVMFCELLRDCQRYFYETNEVSELGDVRKDTLLAAQALSDKEQATDIIAWTLSMQASSYESTGRVEEAIQLNLQGYEMRLAESPRKGGLLGGFEQNLGYNYNTTNQHDTALQWFEKSRDTWTAWNLQQGREADWPAVTKTNMARCLVYLRRYLEAGEVLGDAIAQFKEEEVVNWAMLAFAYFVEGNLQHRTNRLEAAEASFIEAEKLWVKQDQTQRHPFHAACKYKIGAVCLDRGRIKASIEHLSIACDISIIRNKVLPAEHQRCLLKLDEALLRQSGTNKAEGRDGGQPVEDADELDRSVPIFWR